MGTLDDPGEPGCVDRGKRQSGEGQRKDPSEALRVREPIARRPLLRLSDHAAPAFVAGARGSEVVAVAVDPDGGAAVAWRVNRTVYLSYRPPGGAFGAPTMIGTEAADCTLVPVAFFAATLNV